MFDGEIYTLVYCMHIYLPIWTVLPHEEDCITKHYVFAFAVLLCNNDKLLQHTYIYSTLINGSNH